MPPSYTDADLDDVAAYIARTVRSLQDRHTAHWKAGDFPYWPLFYDRFTLISAKSQHTVVETGLSLQTELDGRRVAVVRTAIVDSGVAYQMPDADDPALRTHVQIRGLTWDEYADLDNRLDTLRRKVLRAITQYEQRGRGSRDVATFVAAADAFVRTWGRGERWGGVKNVVFLTTVIGCDGRIDVGVVLNRSAFNRAFRFEHPIFIPQALFQLVLRSADGEVVAYQGYDALYNRAYGASLQPAQDRLRTAIDDFNRDVINPWRVTLGARPIESWR